MGAAAGQTLSQEVFLGYMSTPENWLYFVQDILPDVIRGVTKIIGGDYRNVASAQSVMMAVQATGDSYGQVIPDSVLETAKNPTPEAPAPKAPSTQSQTQGQQQSLKDELNSWGLGSLYDQAWAMKAAGASDESIVSWIRTTDVYKQRFAGNVQRQAAGLTPLSEAEYLSYEDQARQMMRTAGLPAGFYDAPEDFANFIGKDVSVSELNTRVQDANQLLNQAPPEYRQQLQQLYGVDNGAMTAYILDPDKALPAIEQQIRAAGTAGIAQIAGYGQLTRQQAEMVAQLTGSEAQARQGFADLANKRFLLQGFAGEEGITAEQALSAEFGGNADAAAALSRRQKARLASFTSGQFASGQKGVAGVGVAQSTAS